MLRMLDASDAAAMLQLDVAVVVLLTVIMLLLVATLGFILSSPGRTSCSKGNKKRTTHIYETIEDEEELNRVTQVLKIRVASGDGASIQQDMLLRVQVEAIPLLSDADASAPTSPSSLPPKSPALSAKPLLLHQETAPTTPTLQHLGELKPVVPPRKLSAKIPVSPTMIKDPSLIQSQPDTSQREQYALVHRPSSEETSGYLTPTILRKGKSSLE